MKITIIHVSRGRSSMAFETAKLWAAHAVKPKDIQYILSIDNDEPELRQYEDWYYKARYFFGQTNIAMDDNNNVVQAANHGAKLAVGELIILISDDFQCPESWDEYLLGLIDTTQKEALQINDGIMGDGVDILTLPILTKKLVDELGYIYNPLYTGIMADQDLGYMCREMGVLKKDFTKSFFHIHWRNKKREKDETDNRHENQLSWALGKAVFSKRQKQNFGVVK